MRVFIVHAHHEPKSFNGAMTRIASAGLVPGIEPIPVALPGAQG